MTSQFACERGHNPGTKHPLIMAKTLVLSDIQSQWADPRAGHIFMWFKRLDAVDTKGADMKTLMGAIVLGLSFGAFAQEKGTLDVLTVVQKEEVVVSEDGKTESRLVAIEAIAPGERVFYTITFTNVGSNPAENVVIINPIATELTYVEGSAFAPGMAVQFSVDDGVSFASAADLTVTEDDEVRAAGPEDFTHIRWVMQDDLEIGSQGMAQFAAVLN